jgi:hypothetical protein
MGMGRAQLLGVVVLGAAAVGCGGQLAQPDGGGGAGGGWTPVSYAWVGGTVTVAPTGAAAAAAEGLTLVLDQTVTFTPTTGSLLPNGAYLEARNGCSAPGLGLYEVDIYSCAELIYGGTATPGCVALVLTPDLVMGNYIDASGVSWQVASVSADIHLPPPTPQGGPPTEAAVGSLTFEGRDGSGNTITFEIVFSLPVLNRQLLC